MLDSVKIKNKLSVEDIIKICCFLQGSEEYYWDAQSHPIFSTVLDHPTEDGGSFKLYYYPETKMFHCYTRGDSYDIFELVSRANQCEFKEAFDYVVNFFHLRQKGFEEDAVEELTSDWDIFQKMQDYKKTLQISTEIPTIPNNLLEYFYPLAAPREWLDEGISAKVMYTYGIRVESALHHIIIPQTDINGNLVGIRRRSFDPFEIDAGKKYMPVFIQGDCYNIPTSKTLFGLHESQDTIRKTKKVLLVEGEKSVMKIATYYGIENTWAVATYGSSLSKEHIKLLLDLGIQEVVLGYDREFNGRGGEQDVIDYQEKLLKVVSPLLPYVNVSIILDTEHLTDYKDAPVDKGKEVFEKLYHNRIKLYTPADKDLSRRK